MNLTHEDALAACAPQEPLYVPSTEEVLTVTAIAADLVKLEGEGEIDHTIKEEKEEVREVVEVVMSVDSSAVEMKEVDDAVKEVLETAAAEMGSETVAMDADTLSALSPPVPTIGPLPTTSVITSAVTASAVTASAVTAAAAEAVVVTIAPTVTVELPIRSKPTIPSVLLCPMVLTLTLRFLSLTFRNTSYNTSVSYICLSSPALSSYVPSTIFFLFSLILL